MKFRPCIDLHGGKVKQIVGGTLQNGRATENFVSSHDAAHYAEMFRNDGLNGGHVIMLGPGNEAEAVKALKAYPGGLQVGGGINPENAERYLAAGASHVIVTSYVFQDGVVHEQNLEKMVAAVGRDRLVLDLSCRKKDNTYYVVTDKWQVFTTFEINEANIADLSRYCNEFLIHAADVEGLRRGVEEELVARLGKWAVIPTTYAGGIRDTHDLELIRLLGEEKLDFTIGSALDIFGGTLSYREMVKWQEARE